MAKRKQPTTAIAEENLGVPVKEVLSDIIGHVEDTTELSTTEDLVENEILANFEIVLLEIQMMRNEKQAQAELTDDARDKFAVLALDELMFRLSKKL